MAPGASFEALVCAAMTHPTETLVVDLDGTLTPADTLMEAVVRLVKQSPFQLVQLVLQLLMGKAAFKRYVAANSALSPETLPYREELLDYLRRQKRQGRRLILATASHKTVADSVARHLGIFDDVLATDTTNLKGKNKLKAIRQVTDRDFAYAGDSAADMPIWAATKAAVLVDTSPATTKAVRQTKPIEAEFPKDPVSLGTWAKTLRIHQWSKNLLIFVPLLTAFSFLDVGKLIDSVVAFVAFSLTASATYIVNDLWDLDSDRNHPRKKLRPIASARISIVAASAAAAACLAAGFALAWMLSAQFFMMLVLYSAFTSVYTWVLKRYVLIDVIALSLLFTIRIIAGSVAIDVATSTWLLAFSMFLFLSLSIVKRCSELVSLDKSGGSVASGRDYHVSDLKILWPLGTASAISAVVVFCLFISSPDSIARYASPVALWLVALGLVYWLSRLWIKTARGEMHDDPVVYAIKDAASWIVILFMVATMIVAYYVELSSIS